jgi:hypothetical protein
LGHLLTRASDDPGYLRDRASRAVLTLSSPQTVDDIYATRDHLTKASVTINRPLRDGMMTFVRSFVHVFRALCHFRRP